MAQPNRAAMARLQREPRRIPSINTELTEWQGAVHGGATLLSDERVKFTQEKAAWYIDLPVLKGERDVIEDHVQFLYDQMVQGNFNPLLVTIASCELDGATYKINGQHCSWAKFFLPNYTPEVRELRFRADDVDQLRQLYAQFDRNKSRSEGHLTRMHLASVEGLDDVPVDILARLNQGLKLLLLADDPGRRRARAEDVARLVRDKYVDTYRKVAALYAGIGTANFRYFKRAAVFAALIATVEKAPQVAREFWGAVATGENLARGDSRLTLRTYLMTTGMSVKSGTVREVDTAEEMFRHCLNAWNKWRAGETMTVLKRLSERPRVR